MSYNQNELIRAIINRKIQEDLQTQQGGNGNFLNNIYDASSKVNSIGQGLSAGGEALSGYNPLNGLSSGLQSAGGALQSGASSVTSKLASSLPFSAAGTGGAVAGGATAGAGAAAGAGAGSTAAGASAAGGTAGVAAAGPIGALIALGIAAIAGTNRKRSKKANEQTKQLADTQIDIAKNRLNQTGQITENQQADMIPPQVSNQGNLLDDYIQGGLSQDVPVNNAAQEINNASPQDGIFNNLANGINNFLDGYQENRNQGFSADNLRPDSNKGFMKRTGEGVGTIARAINNPAFRSFAAGTAGTVLTGNPLFGLGLGYKINNEGHKSNMYKDILRQQGIDTDNRGILDSNDLSRILISKKIQKDYMTRGEYDKYRLENKLITADEYNANLNTPDYNPDEMVNISGLNTIARVGRYVQENANDKSKNYYRSKNNGENTIRVKYDEKPDSHSYTHVTYGPKPVSQSNTHVTYGAKPVSQSNTHVTYGEKPASNNNDRVKVKSPDGKEGSIPRNQLQEALKKGYKKL